MLGSFDRKRTTRAIAASIIPELIALTEYCNVNKAMPEDGSPASLEFQMRFNKKQWQLISGKTSSELWYLGKDARFSSGCKIKLQVANNSLNAALFYNKTIMGREPDESVNWSDDEGE